MKDRSSFGWYVSRFCPTDPPPYRTLWEIPVRVWIEWKFMDHSYGETGEKDGGGEGMSQAERLMAAAHTAMGG